MPSLHAAQALLADGWSDDVRITFDGAGITTLDSGVAAAAGDTRVAVLLPGMASLHSHAFQRGMAGLAEIRGTQHDSFWTWRETMYRFALTMSPEQMQAIAAQLYVEMLEAGFTRVGEFHYLHHAPDGQPYDDAAEMAGRICAAAAETGIALTLLPTFYAHATFGGAQPLPGQRRFIHDLDGYARLMAACETLVATLPGGRLGVAPHSLRAVTPEQLAAVCAIAGERPIHIHAAEQVKEVEDCIAWSGQRPVAWLLDHAGLDRRWCLIHATHMTDSETTALAARGAVAGLCPLTEANLGDGIFNGRVFLDADGAIGIGSDSNILIGVGAELRQLEYSQRLRDRSRNVLAARSGSTGVSLYEAAVRGGAQALGVGASGLVVGAPADMVSLDARHPSLAGRRGDSLLDAWIFASQTGADAVWVGGRLMVEAGRHHAREAVAARFTTAMLQLAGA